eukprot:GHVS01004746.1.p1 GENE.GHVS01004746.1~~GHVS01004746.1.p1  ORF type:complete len:603 (+),score=83.67 GHVS01004746.1:440-2248(+)
MYGESYPPHSIDFVDSYEDVAFEGAATDLEYIALLCPNRPIVLLSDCLTESSTSSSTGPSSTTSSPQKTYSPCDMSTPPPSFLCSVVPPPSSPLAFPPSFAISTSKSAPPFFHQHNKKTHPPPPPLPPTTTIMTTSSTMTTTLSTSTIRQQHNRFVSGVGSSCITFGSSLSAISNISSTTLSSSICELEGDASPLPYSPLSLSSPISYTMSSSPPSHNSQPTTFQSCAPADNHAAHTTCDGSTLKSIVLGDTAGHNGCLELPTVVVDVKTPLGDLAEKSEGMVVTEDAVVVGRAPGKDTVEANGEHHQQHNRLVASCCESSEALVVSGTTTTVHYETTTESGSCCVAWRDDSTGEMITAATIEDSTGEMITAATIEDEEERYEDELIVVYTSPKSIQVDLPTTTYDRGHDLMIDCTAGLTNLSKGVSCCATDSASEYLLLSRLVVGKWETLLQRSNPLDPLFKSFGIAYIKRIVVDRLSIPVTLTLQDNESVLDMLVHLPMGNRHMRWALDGSSTLEEDPDCGTWTGYIRGCELRLPWVSDGTPFRALQQVRTHSRIGEVHETRAIVPDSKFGRVLYLNYTLFPKSRPTSPLHVVRILKPIL